MCKRPDRAGGGRADADGIPRPPLGRFLPELYPQKALKCARAVIKKSRQKSVKLALPPFPQPSWRLDWSASCKEAEGLGRIVGSLWPQRPGRAARVIGLGHNPPRCIDRQDRCDFSKVGGKDVNVSRMLTSVYTALVKRRPMWSDEVATSFWHRCGPANAQRASPKLVFEYSVGWCQVDVRGA